MSATDECKFCEEEEISFHLATKSFVKSNQMRESFDQEDCTRRFMSI